MRELEVTEIMNVSGAGVTTTTEPLPGGGTHVIGTVTNDPWTTSIGRDQFLMSGHGTWGDFLGAYLSLAHGFHEEYMTDEDIRNIAENPDQYISEDGHLMCETLTGDVADALGAAGTFIGIASLFGGPVTATVGSIVGASMAITSAVVDAISPDHSLHACSSGG